MKARKLFRHTPGRARLAGLLVLFGGLFLDAMPALASEAAKRSIEAFVFEELEGQGEISVEVLSAAAHFPDCENPQPFMPGERKLQIGRISVGLRCGNTGAVRYLPVQVGLIGSYLTAATTIQPGTVITAAMLKSARGDIGQLPAQAVRDRSAIVGKMVAQRLSPGVVLQEHHLRAQSLVERGETISLESGGRGFRVSRKVEALESGALGDSIRVRLSRRDIMIAEVVGDGRVRPVAGR